jgi:hypothetical protein
MALQEDCSGQLAGQQELARVLVEQTGEKSSSRSRDALCAIAGPAEYFPCRGSNRGWPVWKGSAVDWRLCWPGGTLLWNNTFDDAHCDSQAGKTPCNNGTYDGEICDP